MKKATSVWASSLVLAAGLSILGRAADVTLKVGDPAPKLQVSKWVQGDPVTDFAADKAYVVEFWATWCGPCRVSIPHLNGLHEKFKDKGLVVIGQDCREEREDQVAPFVAKMGDKMTYRVALDRKENDKDDGRMFETWMRAADAQGIPTAFVVGKDRRIAWIGHPMELRESLLEQVLAGTYDVKKAVRLAELSSLFDSAMGENRLDDAEKALNESEALLTKEEQIRTQPGRFDLLCKRKNYAAAYKVARAVSDANLDKAILQNELAWRILTDKSIETRDLPLAETLARRGVDASKGKDPSVLDTLARALFMQDKKAEAVQVQEKAIAVASGAMKRQLTETLESFKQGKLPPAE